MLAAVPLFYQDVLPILERRCVQCHRAGEAAPMALTSYKEARPFARAIRDAVLRHNMPPWFAHSEPGEFANDPRLTAKEIATLRQWADGGAPAGTAAGASKQWPVGWRIGSPDTVIQMPESYSVPARGEVDYQHVIVPTGFTTDRWATAIEVRPSSRAHVHHAVVFVRPPRSIWLRNQPANQLFTAKRQALAGLSTLDEVIGTYLPGADPHILPLDHGKLIPAGSDLIFQIHYTTNGHAAQDQTRIGLIFAKAPPRIRHYSLSIAQGNFTIPPFAAAHPVQAVFPVNTQTEIYALAPHMHLRGKSMRIRAVEPDETERLLLDVPRYDFYWQLVYRPAKPILIPRGTRLIVDALFDNSPGNSRNPDPRQSVGWGEQSREEMAVCFVEFLLPVPISPNEIFRAPRLRGTQ